MVQEVWSQFRFFKIWTSKMFNVWTYVTQVNMIYTVQTYAAVKNE